jgi:hypothetical protein
LRFNRRRSRSRGMLFYRLLKQSVHASPRTCRSLVAEPGAARRKAPVPLTDKRVRPPSLDVQALNRPWQRQSAKPRNESDLVH